MESLFNGVAAGFIIAFAVVLTSIRIACGNIIAAIATSANAVDGRRRLTWCCRTRCSRLPQCRAAANGVGHRCWRWRILRHPAAAAGPFPTDCHYRGRRSCCYGLRRTSYARTCTTTPQVRLTWSWARCSFAAVVLITQHQRLLRPARPIVNRPGDWLVCPSRGYLPTVARSAQAPPGMYHRRLSSFLAQISAVIHAGLGPAVSDASAGWTMRQTSTRTRRCPMSRAW